MLAENRNARRVKRSNQLAWAYQVICEADHYKLVKFMREWGFGL